MTYLLWIVLDKNIKTQVGSLDNLYFEKGIYLYVGSAKRGLKARLQRHLSQKKNIFWHIDYFLSSDKVEIKNIWINGEQKECQIAKMIQKKGYDFINKFGSSDCQCKSHLFFVRKDIRKIKSLLEKEGFKDANKDSF